MGGVVVGGGTLVGSGGAGPQGSEVSLMSSRAMSFLRPPFFTASNTTWTHQINSTISCGREVNKRCPCLPVTVTHCRLLGQGEGNLTVVPVVSIVTILLKYSGGVEGRRWLKLYSEEMDIYAKHVIPGSSQIISSPFFYSGDLNIFYWLIIKLIGVTKSSNTWRFSLEEEEGCGF